MYVQYVAAEKKTQIGGSTPESLAHLLLSELVREEDSGWRRSPSDRLHRHCLPFSIRITADHKCALERLAARAGMSAPMFVEHVLARLVTDQVASVNASARYSPCVIWYTNVTALRGQPDELLRASPSRCRTCSTRPRPSSW